jgi:hypothetical protein
VPFTLAHPAAVLPLTRRPLVPAALVAGTLSPDVPYFLPLPRSAEAWYEPFVNATTTHAWPGALTVAVPTAAALLVVWWFVRAPLRALVAGEAVVGRRGTPSSWTVVGALWGVASLALGVLTHVAWDAFTHGDGAVVQHVAWLREPLIGSTPAARVLQHLSTVAGLLVLASWAVRAVAAWRRAGGRLPLDRFRVAAVLVLFAAAAAGAVLGGTGSAGAGLEAALSAAAKGGGAVLAAAGLVAAAAWWSSRARTVVAPAARRR